MQNLYFAEDGSWGNAEGILIIDIDKWTNDMVDYVEEATDFYRHEIVKALHSGKSLEDVRKQFGN